MPLSYAIGDLHGRFDLFSRAIAAITEFGGGTVVFLGDYVDRGPESRQILEALIAGPPEGQRWVCLAGNHEDLMAAACTGRMDPQIWLENGGVATVRSYSLDTDDDAEIPAAHILWLSNLPDAYADRHRVYVHAGLDPTKALHEQPRRMTGWHRYPDGDPGGYHGKHVVHGHTPHPNGPVRCGERTNLDTGAYATGRLMIAVFDENRPGGPVTFVPIEMPAEAVAAGEGVAA